MRPTHRNRKGPPPAVRSRGGTAFSEVSVRGFKSHRDWNQVELRPLTILAGANSSGKSSVMQALLLLKQTIDDPTSDPRPLRLDGPNVQFTDPAQFLWTAPGRAPTSGFELKLALEGDRAELRFAVSDQEVTLEEAAYSRGNDRHVFREGRLPDGNAIPEWLGPGFGLSEPHGRIEVVRMKCFLGFALAGPERARFLLPTVFLNRFQRALSRIIHLPGHRGNPLRTYPRSARGPSGPGLFHERAAGLIAEWAERSDPKLERLKGALEDLGLTWKVLAKPRDAVSLEVRVGRTARASVGGAHDLVSIADVGFGVAQILPVLVALIEAQPGQMVYIEQPEIHLHPRAQRALADLIAVAVRRGVQVVVETHSDIILTQFQKNIAEGSPGPHDVRAHWFKRDPEGVTHIDSRTPDATGSFGDWPVDFAAVAAEVDRAYNEAAYEQLPLPKPPT